MRIERNIVPRTAAFVEPTLPELATTRAGCAFDPRADHWKLVDAIDSVHLDFSTDTLPVSVTVRLCSKRVLLWYAENRSLRHLFNMYYHFRCMARFMAEGSPARQIEEIDSATLLNYKASLRADTAWYMS